MRATRIIHGFEGWFEVRDRRKMLVGIQLRGETSISPSYAFDVAPSLVCRNILPFGIVSAGEGEHTSVMQES